MLLILKKYTPCALNNTFYVALFTKRLRMPILTTQMKSFFQKEASHVSFFKEHGERIVYKKGQHIVWPADNFPWVYNLESGFARVTFAGKDDDARIIGFFTPGTTFAQVGSFFDSDSGTIEYLAETPVVVHRVKRDAFFEKLDTDKEFAKSYLNISLRNQIFLIDRIVYQGENGISKKMIRWILFMVKYYGVDVPNSNHVEIEIPLTQTTIASFLHVTRESANAAIRELVKKNLIEVSNKKIVILDCAALKKELAVS